MIINSDKYRGYVGLIEDALDKYLALPNEEQASVVDAMRYSTLDSGKRLRGVLTLEFCRGCGGHTELALPFACAVEMVHAYSLIHDDLPCMDDDDTRRGKPSCHIKYGEALAVLAGDALLTKAFEVVANAGGLSAETRMAAVKILADAAGVDGMIGGQVLDMGYEGRKMPQELLEKMCLLKTAAMISVSARLGCVAAGADVDKIAMAGLYGQKIGLAFQIVDDILDVTSTEQDLGKPVGSDSGNLKSTYASVVGLEKSRRLTGTLIDEALEVIEGNYSFEDGFMRELTLWLADRTR